MVSVEKKEIVMKLRNLLFALLLAAGVVSVCRGEEVKTEPKFSVDDVRIERPIDVCRKVIGCLNQANFGGAAEYCTGNMLMLVGMAGSAPLAEKDLEAYRKDWGNIGYEWTGETIDGDKAVVSCIVYRKDTKESKKGEFLLKKVDGKWKLADMGDPSASKTDSAVADGEDAQQLMCEGQAYFNGDNGKPRNFRKAKECFVKAKARGAKDADTWIKMCDKMLKGERQ